jgi:hypothetical protein
MGTTDYDCSLLSSTDVPGSQGNINKLEHIRASMAEKMLKFTQVVLLEDDARAVGALQSICRTIHVTSGIGMQEREIQLVRNMLASPTLA